MAAPPVPYKRDAADRTDAQRSASAVDESSARFPSRINEGTGWAGEAEAEAEAEAEVEAEAEAEVGLLARLPPASVPASDPGEEEEDADRTLRPTDSEDPPAPCM